VSLFSWGVVAALALLYLMLAMAFDLLFQAVSAWARDWPQIRRPCVAAPIYPASSGREGGPSAICVGPPLASGERVKGGA
jgi:hypothetical protein